jgi:hypothetical protein
MREDMNTLNSELPLIGNGKKGLTTAHKSAA